jgi:hypothetical protein
MDGGYDSSLMMETVYGGAWWLVVVGGEVFSSALLRLCVAHEATLFFRPIKFCVWAEFPNFPNKAVLSIGVFESCS